MTQKNNEKDALEEVSKKISDVKERRKNAEKSGDTSIPRLSVELISGVLIGLFAGYYLDKWLGTQPIFFIICFFFGVAGGALNIYKLARKSNNE